LVSAIDDDKVTDVSQELGDKVPSQFIFFWFKKNTLENYLKYISLICKHGGLLNMKSNRKAENTQ
jgi:hypothetical protein